MIQTVEPRVRRLVAEHLGVELDELTPEVSLTDDLAVDSLDIVELAIALESGFGISIPEASLDEMHCYRDLVDTVEQLYAAAQAEVTPAPRVWARVIPARSESAGILERAGTLTSYVAQHIMEDALHAGPGTRLEMLVAPDATDDTLTRLEHNFSWLSGRGVEVLVRRDRSLSGSVRPLRPHAA